MKQSLRSNLEPLSPRPCSQTIVAWCFPLGLTTYVLPNSNGLLPVLLPVNHNKQLVFDSVGSKATILRNIIRKIEQSRHTIFRNSISKPYIPPALEDFSRATRHLIKHNADTWARKAENKREGTEETNQSPLMNWNSSFWPTEDESAPSRILKRSWNLIWAFVNLICDEDSWNQDSPIYTEMRRLDME